jgi:hypothetical protein
MPTRTHLTDADIGVTVQAFGGGGGAEQQRSSRMGWVFPDSIINPVADIEANKWHTLSAMWYELNSSGDFVKRDSSSFGSNFFYTAANALTVRKNSTVALVNLSSGSPTAVNALTASSTKRNALITELVTFCDDNNFDGVDLDLETFKTASMSAVQYENFKTLLRELGFALHQKGLILYMEVPPTWNTAPNTESGTGDAWDSENSQGYYRLRLEDLNDLPVDGVVIMAYDYQYDYSAGEPNQPLKWLKEVLEFNRSKLNEGKIRIIAGIPSAGYSGTTGGYSITGRTYDYLSVQTGFSGASRDSGSGELIWANAGTSYAAIDDTAIQLKVAQAEEVGIFDYALWHVGNNKYGGADFTTTQPQRTPASTVRFTDNGSIILPENSFPTASGAGEMKLFARKIANRLMPAFIGSSGLDSALQPLLARNKIGYWNPPGNANTVPGVFGFTAPVVTGFTATARNVATTNLFTRLRRLGYVTATTVGAVGQWRVNASQFTVGDATSGLGGFTFIMRFGISDAAAVSDARMFIGMRTNTTPTNVEPSTITQCIGVGHNAAHTNLHIFYGGTSAQTPIDLGVNFPITHGSVNVYELALFSAPNSGDVHYQVTRLNTGHVATGTIVNSGATVLPTNTTLIGVNCYRTNNATALAVGLDVMSAYIETDY